MDFSYELETFIEIGGRLIKSRMQAYFEQKGLRNLTIVQFKYLEAVHQHNEITITDLADAFGVRKPSATAIVNELIERKLLTKKQSKQDRRVYHLALAKQAEEMFKAKKMLYKEMADKIEGALSKKQAKQFIEIFTYLREKYERGEI